MVPDPEVMPEWAKKKGMLGTYKDLCKNTVGYTWWKRFETHAENTQRIPVKLTSFFLSTGIEEGNP